MKLLELITRLKKSEVYKEYYAKNPASYLCAGFFLFDLDSGKEEIQLDYSCDKDIVTFYLEEEIKSKPADSFEGKIPHKISEELDFDLEKIKEIAKEEAEKSKIRLNKVITILQILDGKEVLSLNCMAGLKILKIKIDVSSFNVLSSEVVSLFEIGKVVKK